MKLPNMRDDFVQLKDIAYYKSILKMGVWRYHHNDFDSVKMWALEHPNDIFIWHEKDDVIELPSILGIQTSWQKAMMLKYGHNGAIAMDATFEINISKYPLFSLLVFDDWRNDIPVAWVLTSRITEEDLVICYNHYEGTSKEISKIFFLLASLLTMQILKRMQSSKRGLKMRFRFTCVLSMFWRIGKITFGQRYLIWVLWGILFTNNCIFSRTFLLNTKSVKKIL